MVKYISAACAALLLSAGASIAVPLNGTFDVDVVNVSGVNSMQSEATIGNFNNAVAGSLGTQLGLDLEFTYTGDINFATNSGDATTINSWLATGSNPGTVSNLDPGVGGLTQSTGNINNGTATTTFYLFSIMLDGAFDFTVNHDDGIAFYDDGNLIGASVGPTSEITTNIGGFNGGLLEILYVATNSDPSVLNVDVAPVPLPAGGLLLIGGLGGLGFMARRRRKQKS